MNEVFNYLVEDVGHADTVELLDLLLVLVHGELLEFGGILDDLNDSLLLFEVSEVVVSREVIVHAVSNDLVDVFVLPVVNSGLIQDVVLELLWSLFW